MTLGEYLAQLQTAEIFPCPDPEEWAEMIARISTPGRINEVTEECYWYFLEVLPPKHMRTSMFAFAEGAEPRVGSHWCTALDEAINARKPTDQLPRIEACPVIFQGTYDEHNWQVLRRRWDDLRAQLHGIVIRPSESPDDQEGKHLISEISDAAPSFSPRMNVDE